jgi:PPOX class probable F420-dependent enzyme
MPAIPESVVNLIASGRLGHLVTLNPDGSPQVSCVWVGIEGDEMVTAHLRDHRKVRNVRVNHQVAISMESDRTIQQGPWLLKEYVVIYGKARIQEGGAAEWLRHLSQI